MAEFSDYVKLLGKSAVQNTGAEILSGYGLGARLAQGGRLEDAVRVQEGMADEMGYRPTNPGELAAQEDLIGLVDELRNSAVGKTLGEVWDYGVESAPHAMTALVAAPQVLGSGRAMSAGRALQTKLLRNASAPRAPGKFRGQQGHFRLPEFKKAAEAVDALRRGMSPQDVWKRYQIAELPGEGTMVTEVSDHGTKLHPGAALRLADGSYTVQPVKNNVLAGNAIYGGPLAEVLRNAGTTIEGRLSPSGEGTMGWFDPTADHIGVYPSRKENLLKTILHEGQHKTQQIDGLPGGANPESWGYSGYRRMEKGSLANRDAYQKYLENMLDDLRMGGENSLIVQDPAVGPWGMDLGEARARLKGNFPTGFDSRKSIVDALKSHPLLINDSTYQARLNDFLTHDRAAKSARERADDAFSKYNNNLGEVMARLTSERMTIPQKNIGRQFPFDEQYLRYLVGAEKSKLHSKSRP